MTPEHPQDAHPAQLIAAALRHANVIPADPRQPADISDNAQAVLERRYLKQDPDGNASETADDMYRRVAHNLAESERNYGAGDHQVQETAARFYDLLRSHRFLPNSPTLMNAGRELQQLSACFVLPVPDDLDGIFQAVRNTALIHKSGGGTGFDFSSLRPAGDPVASTRGVASGPVSFMDAFDSATEVVKQGGTRRGANMGILRVDHPDILQFTARKRDGSKLQNFNISVAVTDNFMTAAAHGQQYYLIHPKTGEATHPLDAAAVLDQIVDNAWETGDPGLVFLDAVNRDNPNPHLGSIQATNPCVAADTVVATSEGPRTVAQLVGRPFVALVNGRHWPSTSQGFFYSGYRRALTLETNSGHTITLTPDHRVRVRTEDGDRWTPAAAVQPGDRLVLNDPTPNRQPEEAYQLFQALADIRGVAVAEPEITDTAANPVTTVTNRRDAGWADVYDAQIPGVNAFDGNGLYVHQCGEQPLGPNESCNLGSLNLARMVRYHADTQAYEPDYNLIRETVKDAVHLLDNVIDANHWPLPEIAVASQRSRRIGLGVMGFADLLIMLGIPYGSERARETASELMVAIREYAWEASRALAEERGPYPAYAGSRYESDGAGPMRNTAPVTIAPTGTISIIAGASSGIEPLFALAYQRNVMDHTRLAEFNPLFEAAAACHGFNTPDLLRHVQETGSADHPDAPAWVRELFAVSHQIPPADHVAMQAAFQKHTDNAVSKTINLPADATREDVRQAYLQAWQSGCKGITVYRDGSKAQQVLSTGSAQPAAAPPSPQPRPRPRVLDSRNIRVNTAHGPCYVTVTMDPDHPGQPFDLFANMGKAGSCDAGQIEAICRLASTAIRAGVSPQEVVDQLDGITCHPSWDGGRLVKSTPDAIAVALDIFIHGLTYRESEAEQVQLNLPFENARPAGPQCPDCGRTTRVAEGCETCHHCGWSQCE